ncbi:hypothetical protein KR50_12750 [Jeotgalibacillus campisalis]|uniref:Uncharacterized protein n=1 Tax=Jeotgalibacillus campisalis TaxID=220754 RepID=A0A0C2REM2_9BACL|nr:hypothetical protein KR50_12750 [Jeotgalibacillus campisalis]
MYLKHVFYSCVRIGLVCILKNQEDKLPGFHTLHANLKH